MSDAKSVIESQLELVVNVASVTIMTLMRMIEARGIESIGEEEMAQFEQVRSSVLEAAGALQEWQASDAAQEVGVDLSAIEAKIEMLQSKLDEWPFNQETPPS